MSSFKKLRLDPGSQSQCTSRNLSSNVPGATDNVGRLHDILSVPSTSSGERGNGSYSRSSTGPFRTRYSRPLDIPPANSSSFSRFAPYYFGKERRSSLKVPLIRARRDESEQDGLRPSSRASLTSSVDGESPCSATSSTAQRIIETLQNLSTPVLNAGKIRIDQDIKAVQPLSFGTGSSFQISPGRSSGPPKVCSSLLLSNPAPANQISPNLGDQRQRRLFCIPKMVDAATNTDKEVVEISSVSPHTSALNKVGNEMKITSSASPISSKNVIPISKSRSTFTVQSKDDNSDEEFHECTSEFTFSPAWSQEIFENYFSGLNENKSVSCNTDVNTGGTSSQQTPLLNGFNGSDSTPTSLNKPQSSDIPAVTRTSFSFPSTSTTTAAVASDASKRASDVTPSFTGFQSQGSGVFTGSSSAKDPFSLNKQSAAAPSEENKDAFKPKLFALRGNTGIGSASTPYQKPDAEKLVPARLDGGSITGGFTDLSQKPATLTSPSIFSSGLGKDSLNSSSHSSQPFASPSSDKVDAPKQDNVTASRPADSVVTTSETKLSLPPLTVKSAGNKWRCPTCMVENELAAQACVCCSEKNPNKVVAPSKPVATKWRCPTCMVENAIDAEACVCCSEKNPKPVKPVVKKWRCPTCMVDNEPRVPACVCCSEKNPNAAKAEENTSNTVEPAPTFKFGLSNPSSTLSSANASFTFGNAPANPSNSQNSPVATFKFGIVAPTTSSVPTPTPTPTPSFKFGSAAPSQPPVTFGLPAPAPASAITQPSTSNASATPVSIFGSKSAIEPNNVTSSTTVTGTSVFGSSAGFQSQIPTQPASGFTFGAAAAASSDSPKPTSGISFGSPVSMNKPAFAFPFGGNSQQNAGATTSTTSSAATPAPTPVPSKPMNLPGNFSFGSTNPPVAGNLFGQVPSVPSIQPPVFQFGGAPPTNPSPAPAPVPFSLTPHLNFSAVTPGNNSIPFGNPTQPTPTAGSQPPPALFQFNASGSNTNSDSPGGRRIKKAVRRFNK